MKTTSGQGGHAPIATSRTEHLLAAVRAVLADRECELLELKGPCSNKRCRLHYAHSGPCDERSADRAVTG